MTFWDRYIDCRADDWHRPDTGEVVDAKCRLTIGANVVSVDKLFSQRFDLRAQRMPDLPPNPNRAPSAKRGEISDFTRASQKRLQKILGCWEVDGQLLCIALTYPGEGWPSGKVAKEHFKAFLRIMRREYPELAGMWKVEYQQRGAPHFHLVLQTGEVRNYARYLVAFQAWVKVAWLNANGMGGRTEAKWARDRDRARFYLTKEVGKTVQSSRSWAESIGTNIDHYGRFWGWHLKSQLRFQARELILPVKAGWIAGRVLQQVAAEVMLDEGRLVETDAGFSTPRGRVVQDHSLPRWQLTNHAAHVYQLIRNACADFNIRLPELHQLQTTQCPFAEDQLGEDVELWEEPDDRTLPFAPVACDQHSDPPF